MAQVLEYLSSKGKTLRSTLVPPKEKKKKKRKMGGGHYLRSSFSPPQLHSGVLSSPLFALSSFEVHSYQELY
jgi:hypothetical protein